MNQGLLGALEQFWTIEEKPRLHRKNTYFDDVQVSNAEALRVGTAVIVLGMALIIFWSITGAVL